MSRGRLIAIGDIHGCYDELRELLDRIGPGSADTVISVGDIVRKGPEPVRCLELWRKNRFLAVRGNNENRLLDRAESMLRFPWEADRELLRRDDLMEYIASWPLVIDVPDAGVSVVHGGFLPNSTITTESLEAQKQTLSTLRWIRKVEGKWTSSPEKRRTNGDVLWSEKWKGERFVVYGHTPLQEPRFDPRALGLDTGCVYGGALTGAILKDGEWSTLQVVARRPYSE
ncbi:MAG TPA: metallophosphoesterase family protein [Thermoanaerobaculia bacterium]